MSNPTVVRTIGVNGKSGIGYIVCAILDCDMGEHGKAFYPMHLTLSSGREVKFSWTNPKTGNVIYREVTRK